MQDFEATQVDFAWPQCDFNRLAFPSFCVLCVSVVSGLLVFY
jgi:hypothetical protein